jgi:hypothetical protein
MIKIVVRVLAATVVLGSMTVPGLRLADSPALASTEGDTCRKQVCDSAVEACMGTDLSLLPIVRTEARRKNYCADLFNGCMARTIVANMPWYSVDTVARFLKCPR